jgi:phosphoribosylaminoimidazole-succinocarboxamide synthase
MAATDSVRVARTESFFRDVNERISEAARKLGADYAEFVCECADAECSERFTAQLEEYDEVRADGRRFLVAPGHEEPQYERVVERNEDHGVVRKDTDASVAAEVLRLNPRPS